MKRLFFITAVILTAALFSIYCPPGRSTEAGEKLVLNDKGIDYVFHWCPPGKFLMGSPESEKGRFADEIPHNVELTRGFWLLETEVTQKMFQSVTGKNPSAFSSNGSEENQVKNLDTSEFPVESLLPDEISEFCKKMSAAFKGTVSLPTEAQWEYACRAGSAEPFAVKGNSDCWGWYWNNSKERTHKVRSKKANAWGLYDMHGNVAEWCSDGFTVDSYSRHEPKDPMIPSLAIYGNSKIVRGGSWEGSLSACRSAARDRDNGETRQEYIGFRVVFLPRFTQGIPENYRKQWKELEPQILNDIEKYRKANAVLKFTDQNGTPLSDVDVDIQQISHEFRFGCNILVLGQLGDQNSLYEEKFLKLFNLATSTLCMKIYHPSEKSYLFGENEQNVWRRPQPDRVLRFCKEHGIEMKGQPVIAGSWHPDWVAKDYDKAKKQYSDWIKALARRYDGKIQIIDLVNEALCHCKKEFSLYEPEYKYVGWAFQEAKKYFKKSTLEINEATHFTVSGSYYRFLKKLFDAGIPIDSIACQYHHFNRQSLQQHLEKARYWKLREEYNQLAEFGRPLYISEITIPATYGADENEGEAIQAEVLSNLYHLWFSIPKMAGIIHWNFCDGAAWGGDSGEGRVKGGLLDPNMREKPAYLMLDRLINQQWRTKLTNVKTDQNGLIKFRGFRGHYKIYVRTNPKDPSQRGSFEIVLTGSGGEFPHSLKIEK